MEQSYSHSLCIKLYRVLGIVFFTAGLFIALGSHFTLRSVPLEGIGIAVAIFGMKAVFLAPSVSNPAETRGRQTLNKLMLSLVIAFGVSDVFLIILKEADVSVFFIANILAFLVVTLAFNRIGSRPRVALNAVAALIFLVFLVIVALKLTGILMSVI